MKIWQKIKLQQDGKKIKKYKFCGITILRKEKSLTKKKWNIFGVKVTKRSISTPIELEHLFRVKCIGNKEKIDILIPVYNGYDYLQKLFSSIKNNTDLPYRLFVINDCSPDARIIPFLEKQKKIFSDLLIIENNSANLGFVKSINRLLSLCKGSNHVVIINTDVVLPKNWASRLMQPIFDDKKVASVTPFSNAATIFSLPILGKDNDFSADLEKINEHIRKLNGKNKLLKFATGVGFCLAINKKALKKVGKFDEVFEQGYGEENDWCQRAIKKGFYNTLATNLFVWHKHGGSFESAQKKEFIKKHLDILKNRYPRYEKDVLTSIKNPYYRCVHFIAELLYFNALANSTQLWFDHDWGGGANFYTENQFKKLKDNTFCVRIKNNISQEYLIDYTYKDYNNAAILNMEQIKLVIAHMHITKIVVNNLATYQDALNTLKDIEEIKKTTKSFVSFRGHDLQCICPTITMLDYNNKYCNCKNFNHCALCIRKNKNMLMNCRSIEKWHQSWKYFLQNVADEIIVFSFSTFDIYTRLYDIPLDTIKIIPHTIKPLRKVTIKPHKTINIGIIGAIGIHKGLDKIKNIDKVLPKYKNVKLIIIGYTSCDNSFENTEITGAYDVKDLPNIIEKFKIDVIFIPSIWPETFSYTTEEAMSMGIPLACYNIGAPAERVCNYKKGIVINSMEDDEKTLTALIDCAKNWK